MSQKLISVSWVSVKNDPFSRDEDGQESPGPTLEFLLNRKSPVFDRVQKHYLLVRRPPGTLRVELADNLVDEIGKDEYGPEVEIINWDTSAAPTDHQALFLFTAEMLTQIRRQHPNERIAVNLSPGTPAAQTVMLLALQARILGENVIAYQGVPKKYRKDESEVLQEVHWNLLDELGKNNTPPSSIAEDEWSLETARSPRLREVAMLVKQYGSVPFPVLIIGARGSGKTRIAHHLRMEYMKWQVKAKKASEWQFHLNCADFRGDSNMLRSELFGYEQGAHSTAHKASPGLLERADEDCVFLDEIHWMDSHAQGGLLLAVQRNGTFRRLGGHISRPSKFRLIAATNKTQDELRALLAPDFLDRISDLVITLPDLRDCREDLGDIWKSVVRDACEELVQRDPVRAVPTSRKVAIVDDHIAQFQRHHNTIVRAISNLLLPGNYRDLEKLARRIIVGGLQEARRLAISEQLVEQELDRLKRTERQDEDSSSSRAESLFDELPAMKRCETHLRKLRDQGGYLSGPRIVEQWEHRLLTAAHNVAGSGSKAAELLGMNQRTFNAKLKTMQTD